MRFNYMVRATTETTAFRRTTNSPPVTPVWTKESHQRLTSKTRPSTDRSQQHFPAQTMFDGPCCLQGMSHLKIERHDSANTASAFGTAINTSKAHKSKKATGKATPESLGRRCGLH